MVLPKLDDHFMSRGNGDFLWRVCQTDCALLPDLRVSEFGLIGQDLLENSLDE
jgi:hypothetical protein